MSIEATKLQPIISMYVLRQHYRSFDVDVDWLVTTVTGVSRNGARHYKGPLIEVLRQTEDDFAIGLLPNHMQVESPADLLNTLISSNGNSVHLMIFDLQHNRQLM